jgi:hypothetical protein
MVYEAAVDALTSMMINFSWESIFRCSLPMLLVEIQSRDNIGFENFVNLPSIREQYSWAVE